MKKFKNFLNEEYSDKFDNLILCQNIEEEHNLQNEKIGDFDILYDEFHKIDNILHDHFDKYVTVDGGSDYPETHPNWYDISEFRVPRNGFDDDFIHEFYISLGMYRTKDGYGKLKFNYKKIKRRKK